MTCSRLVKSFGGDDFAPDDGRDDLDVIQPGRVDGQVDQRAGRALGLRGGRPTLGPDVMDNLSTHWTVDIRRWAVNNNVDLLATPTYSSWLNRIECHL